VCVCVCVCEREREREKGMKKLFKHKEKQQHQTRQVLNRIQNYYIVWFCIPLIKMKRQCTQSEHDLSLKYGYRVLQYKFVNKNISSKRY
jgi:hypothetical protein